MEIIGGAVVATKSQGPNTTTAYLAVTAQSHASGAALLHLIVLPPGTCDFQGIFT